MNRFAAPSAPSLPADGPSTKNTSAACPQLSLNFASTAGHAVASRRDGRAGRPHRRLPQNLLECCTPQCRVLRPALPPPPIARHCGRAELLFCWQAPLLLNPRQSRHSGPWQATASRQLQWHPAPGRPIPAQRRFARRSVQLGPTAPTATQALEKCRRHSLSQIAAGAWRSLSKHQGS